MRGGGEFTRDIFDTAMDRTCSHGALLLNAPICTISSNCSRGMFTSSNFSRISFNDTVPFEQS